MAEPPDPRELGNAWYDGFHALVLVPEIEQLGGFDVVHDHAGVVGPVCGAMLHGRPAGRAHVARAVDRRRRASSTASSRHTCTSSRSATRSAPTTPTCRTLAPCTTASTSARTRTARTRTTSSCYIGRANPDKGPKEAINIARRAGLPLHMILKRSEPPEREYFEREIEPVLASDVELHENVSHELKVDLLGRARAMIFPIRWPEPFGLVMVEAMACGTPVVTTNWGAAPELVDDGVTGFRRDGEDDLVEAVGKARVARPRRLPPAGRGPLLRRRRWCGATRRVYEAATRPERPRPPDFHYGRSVITMAGDGPATALEPPSKSTTSTSASTAARSCAASRSPSSPARSTP